MEMLKGMLGTGPEAEQKKEQVNAEIAKQKEQLVEQFAEKGKKYKADEAALDKAAFAVLDKNANGQLEKQEVIDGLFPGTDKHYEFMQALGMMTAQEVEAEKAMQQQMDQMAEGGCPQQ